MSVRALMLGCLVAWSACGTTGFVTQSPVDSGTQQDSGKPGPSTDTALDSSTDSAGDTFTDGSDSADSDDDGGKGSGIITKDSGEVTDSGGTTTSRCRNGKVEPGEQCDINDLDGQTCASIGYDGGTLVCTLACQFDTRSCTLDTGGGGPSGSTTAVCLDSCEWADDGVCDDGGVGSSYDVCGQGTDCTDCGSRTVPSCVDTCVYADDGMCDDGGPGSLYNLCDYGSDCADCGAR